MKAGLGAIKFPKTRNGRMDGWTCGSDASSEKVFCAHTGGGLVGCARTNQPALVELKEVVKGGLGVSAQASYPVTRPDKWEWMDE